VYYRRSKAQTGVFPAKTRLPREPVNTAVSGTETAGSIKVRHYIDYYTKFEIFKNSSRLCFFYHYIQRKIYK
jgi:hypothetical protein